MTSFINLNVLMEEVDLWSTFY